MSLNKLDEALNIVSSLVIPFLEDDVDVIQKLDDEPNDVGGLTAAELKAKFDEAANIIKTYLNETLVPQLSDTVAEAEVRAQAEAERIANEMARVEGENLREEAEDARVQAEEGRAVFEQTRQTDEKGRKTSETNRISAESTRQTNEQQRQSQESTRQANEETRQSQESTRQTDEQTRQNQEQARQTAEVLRATAEQERKTAEAQRANAETTRQTDEQTRQSNEQARKTAEAQREINEQNRKDSFTEEIDQAKSWAVGGTGKRPGEDTNNAKYWSEQAKANVGGDFATNERVNQVETEVDRVAQSVSDLETQVEQDVGQAIQEVNQTISNLSQSVNTRVQPINLGGTGATTAEQALANLGGIAAGAVGNLHVWERVQDGVTDYLTSTDRNAYTDGTVGNTTITYLGQLGGGARIEVGSYVGTGTYGSSNPNSLTFGFAPKIVIIYCVDFFNMAIFSKNSKKYSVISLSDTTGGGICEFKNSGKTLEYYYPHNSPDSQLNDSGYEYHYIAIG